MNFFPQDWENLFNFFYSRSFVGFQYVFVRCKSDELFFSFTFIFSVILTNYNLKVWYFLMFKFFFFEQYSISHSLETVLSNFQEISVALKKFWNETNYRKFREIWKVVPDILSVSYIYYFLGGNDLWSVICQVAMMSHWHSLAPKTRKILKE